MITTGPSVTEWVPHSRLLSEEDLFWKLRGILGWDNTPSDRLFYEDGDIVTKRADEKYGECYYLWCPYDLSEVARFIERFDLYRYDISPQVTYYLTAGEEKSSAIIKSYLDLAIHLYNQGVDQ